MKKIAPTLSLDAGVRPLVHSSGRFASLQVLHPLRVFFVLAFVLAAANPVIADVPADQLERARLLRELLEDAPPRQAVPDAPAAELPGAKLEVDRQRATETLRARERLQIQQFQDEQWRRTLGEQQMNKHRPDPAPSPGAAGRAMGFEREQRMRNLSIQIQRQNLQYRLNR